MITQLFNEAVKKIGSQKELGKKLGINQGRVSAFKNYKTGDKRKPNDETILKIAEILGLDKGETLYKAKLELEPEKAYLWKWCAQREHNPRPPVSKTKSRIYKKKLSNVPSWYAFLITFSYVFIQSKPQRQQTNHSLNVNSALC